MQCLAPMSTMDGFLFLENPFSCDIVWKLYPSFQFPFSFSFLVISFLSFIGSFLVSRISLPSCSYDFLSFAFA